MRYSIPAVGLVALLGIALAVGTARSEDEAGDQNHPLKMVTRRT